MQITILGLGKSTIAAIDYLLNSYPDIKIKVSEAKQRPSVEQEPGLLTKLEQKGVIFSFNTQSNPATTKDFIRGSDLIITSPGIPPNSPVMKVIAEAGLRSRIISDFDLFTSLVGSNYIAVTGTNGKTTTTSLIAHLLGVEPLGNIGTPFMSALNSQANTEALMTLNDRTQKPYGFYVTELSSFQLFYSRLGEAEISAPGFKIKSQAPRIAVYLNFTPDHMDWHSDMEEYRLSKEKLFTSGAEVLVLNYDDPVCRALGERLLAENTKAEIRFFSTQFSSAQAADQKQDPSQARIATYYKDGKLFLRKKNIDIEILDVSELKIVGEHNYSNALAALLAAEAAGLDLVEIRSKLKTFMPVAHRMEYVATIAAKAIYNDSKATNPESSEKALKAFPKCIAIVGGKDKKLDMSLMLDLLVERASKVICIGEIKTMMRKGLEERSYTNAVEAHDLKEALRLALDSKENLPIVFTPGTSSFDMFKNYEDRGEQFKSIVMTVSNV